MSKAIKDLKKTKGNPRIINDEQLEKLNDRLAEFGDLSGVVFNEQLNELVGGNQRSTLFSLKNAQIEYIEQFDEPTKDGSTAFGFITIDDQRFNYREVKWDKKKHKRAVLIANTNAGDWDLEALQGDDWSDINFELDIDFSGDENLEEENKSGFDGEDDYSDKNREVDIDSLDENMTMKFVFSKDEFLDVQERLNVVSAKQNVETKEQALFELLNFYVRHGA